MHEMSAAEAASDAGCNDSMQASMTFWCSRKCVAKYCGGMRGLYGCGETPPVRVPPNVRAGGGADLICRGGPHPVPHLHFFLSDRGVPQPDWRPAPIDGALPDHRGGVSGIHLLSALPRARRGKASRD